MIESRPQGADSHLHGLNRLLPQESDFTMDHCRGYVTSLPPSFFRHLSDHKFDIRTAAEVQLASLFIPDDATAIDVGNHYFV